jgi:hypothetical protein
MSAQISQPLRVAMLARVVFPLHGFGGIERHVFHLVTHLARLGRAGDAVCSESDG